METFSTHNIEQLITYPFKDPRWQTKLLFVFLAVLFGFIPILPWLVLTGYLARVMRLAANTPGLPDKLPEWDDFGDLLMDGLRQFAVMFIYFLPATVFFFAAYAAMIAGVFADMGFGRYGMYPGYNGFPPLLPMLGFFFLFGLSMLFSVVVGFFTPAVITHTAVKRSFAAAFKFKEWWQIFRANWKAFLIALVLMLGLIYALMFVYNILFFTIVLICLTPLAVAALYAYLLPILGTLFGAAYREALQNLHPASLAPAEPVEPDEPAPAGAAV